MLRNFDGGRSERVWDIVTSNETFVHQRDPYDVWDIVTSNETFVHQYDPYDVWDIVTGNETFVHQYDPETKQQSSV